MLQQRVAADVAHKVDSNSAADVAYVAGDESKHELGMHNKCRAGS